MISVIVPIYNIEGYLPKCIESICCQTFSDLEIILVDDGSTDDCYDICEAYKIKDSRIKVIHQKNSGLVNARKTGIRNSTGDYIAYVDGDDWIEPNMYEQMYQKVIEFDTDIVMCGRYEDTGSYSKKVFHGFNEGFYDRQKLQSEIYPGMIVGDDFFEWMMFPGVWDKLFRRNCVERFQLAVDEGIVMGEDAACTYPCMLNVNSIYIMHSCLYHYRQTTASMVKQKSIAEVERSRFRLLYESVDKSLSEYTDTYDLREQWKKYVLFLMLPRADSLHTSFEKLEYLFPFPKVSKGSNIILYGAGTYGQRLHGYLQRTGFCNVVAWVDRNHKDLREMGLPVQSPDVIDSLEYDAIVIANTYAKSRRGLYQELIRKYPEEKVHMISEDLIFTKETMKAFGLS